MKPTRDRLLKLHGKKTITLDMRYADNLNS